MKLPRERYACVLLVALGIAARSGSGQIVRIAPIVKQAATPGGSERSPVIACLSLLGAATPTLRGQRVARAQILL